MTTTFSAVYVMESVASYVCLLPFALQVGEGVGSSREDDAPSGSTSDSGKVMECMARAMHAAWHV